MIEQKKIGNKWRLIGVFASDEEFLFEFKKSVRVIAPQFFYDTTEKVLKIYDGDKITVYAAPVKEAPAKVAPKTNSKKGKK